MKLYKLTDQNWKTRAGHTNETDWGPGIEHEAVGDPDQELCSDGYIHAYEDPLLGLLMNPVHADICSPVVWESEGAVDKSDGLKVGCRRLKTIYIVDSPHSAITAEHRVRFAILCAKAICTDPGWSEWADAWLGGSERSADAAWAAADAVLQTATWKWETWEVWKAACAAARAAARSAAWLANVSPDLVEYAAASAAASAAESVARYALADKADAASLEVAPIDFVKLAHEACDA